MRAALAHVAEPEFAAQGGERVGAESVDARRVALGEAGAEWTRPRLERDRRADFGQALRGAGLFALLAR